MDENLHIDDEVLMSYLDEELDEHAKMELEIKLSGITSLRDRLEALKTARLAVQQWGTSQTVRSLHKEMMKGLPNKKTPGKLVPIKLIKYSLGIAATVLIVFLAIKGLNSSFSPDDFYDENFVDYQLSGTRGNENYSDLAQNYSNNNLDYLIREKNRASGSLDSLLVALSYLKTNKASKSTEWLEPLTKKERYRHDAGFYLSLAYLKTGNYLKSYELMYKIKNDPLNPYRGRFEENELKRIKELAEK